MNKAMLLKQYMFNNKKKSGRLPSAYQEVEYIENSLTQYINTLVIPTSKTSCEVEFEQPNRESVWLFGADTSWENNGFGFNTHVPYKETTLYPLLYINSSTYIDFEQIEENQRYVFKYGNGVFSINGKEYSVPSFTGTLTNPIYTNCINRNGTPDSLSKSGILKLYSLKFYEDNTIIRDFIPCYRKSDNEVGLYDIINNQFYTNQGTGSFLCGRPLVYDTISGYQQIDYIETTGTQYIDTGIYQNSSARKYIIETSFNTIDTPSYIIRGNYDYISEAFQIDDKGNYYIGYCGSEKGVAGAVANEKNSFECYFSNGSQYVKKNGTTIISMSKAYSSSYSYKITIFKGTIVGTWAKAKLYYLSIYSNGTLVREFIPMRRKLDNELGLYDLVSKVFYTNQGSGTFIAGEVLKS